MTSGKPKPSDPSETQGGAVPDASSAPSQPLGDADVQDLEAFFAMSLDLFCFLDYRGHFRHLNPAWESTLGFTRDELMARPFIEFVHPDDRDRTLGQNKAVRSGGRARGFENRYLTKDGSYRWLLWNSTPDPERGVIYGMARDITERKKVEEERTLLVAELQSSLAEIRELRSILPICAYCRRVRDDDDYWHTVEAYLAHHAKARYSHGICPECAETVFADLSSEADVDDG